MFEPELFRKQISCIEESACDIVGTCLHPRSHSTPPAVIRRPHCELAPGELCPLAPSLYAPACQTFKRRDPTFSSLHIWEGEWKKRKMGNLKATR